MDPRLTCPHRRLNFDSGCFYVRCSDCGAWWMMTRPGDDKPDTTAAARINAPPIDVAGNNELIAALRAEVTALKALSDARGEALDGWKKGVEDANRISQRERERADLAEAMLNPALAVVEAARWFSENVYQPSIWAPEENPQDAAGPGELWAKRLNARLAALDGKKKAP